MTITYEYNLGECQIRQWDEFENFTETLPKDLFSDLANGTVSADNVKVDFSYTDEGTFLLVDGKFFAHAIHDFCKKYKIPCSNVTYIGSSFKLKETYDRWHQLYYPDSEKIRIAYSCFGLRLYHKGSSWMKAVHVPDAPPEHLRARKMNSLNANMSIICRTLLLNELYERNLLDTDNNIYTFHLQMKTETIEVPEKLMSMCPIQYDVHGDWEDVYGVLLKPVPGSGLDFNKIGNFSNIYDNTYVTVTTESSECTSFGDYTNDEKLNSYLRSFHREGFITEKTFRPMLYWQPQLILCTDGTLKELKRCGFKTFSDYWDESYDDEPDGLKRVKMVVDIMQRIQAMDQQELHDMYWDMMPILEHNRNLLLETGYNKTYL
jgi:hypothetical protein